MTIEPVGQSQGGMLSAADFRERIVPAKYVARYLELFIDRNWKGLAGLGDKIKEDLQKRLDQNDLTGPSKKELKTELEKLEKEGVDYTKSFVIEDFSELNVTPFSYDLSIGDHLFSIQNPDQKVSTLTGSEPYLLKPRETVVVITEELIAIPHCYSATIWPRFSMVRLGIFQSMVKIDPTWYGKLGVAMTNLSPTTIEISRGRAFATLLLYELAKPSDVDLWLPADLEWVTVPLAQEFKPWKDELKEYLNKKADALEGSCRLEGEAVKVRGIKRTHLETLAAFDIGREWQAYITSVGEAWARAPHSKTGNRMIGMEALGMDNLKFLEGRKYGVRIQREDLEGQACQEDDLLEAAVQYGKPFDTVAKLPNMIISKVTKDVAPRIQAEVTNAILPRIIYLTLTILGFLGLIALAVTVLVRYLTTDKGISAPVLSVFQYVVIVMASVVVICLIMSSRWSRRAHTSADYERRLGRMEKTYQERIRKLAAEVKNLGVDHRSMLRHLQMLESKVRDDARPGSVNGV